VKILIDESHPSKTKYRTSTYNMYFEIGLHCVIVKVISLDNLHYLGVEINVQINFFGIISSINALNHFSLYYLEINAPYCFVLYHC
jgi:hypothetical protein